MRRRLWLAAAVLLVTAAGTSPFWGPPVLRHVAWFQVRRVEVSGTRYLAPHRVLAASGIQLGQNVWDDPDVWRRALLADSAIADASISRKLPHTLRIRVTEKRPLAYVEDGALDAITADGEILPLDPTRAPIDLPIIMGAWSQTSPAVRHLLLGETDRLTQLDPGLIAEVSEIRIGGPAAHDLILSHRLGDIILPVGASPERLAQLRAVLADLASRLPTEGSSPSSPGAQVDLRYDLQIIVRLPTSA